MLTVWFTFQYTVLVGSQKGETFAGNGTDCIGFYYSSITEYPRAYRQGYAEFVNRVQHELSGDREIDLRITSLVVLDSVKGKVEE